MLCRINTDRHNHHTKAAGILTILAPSPRSLWATAFTKSFCSSGRSETSVPDLFSQATWGFSVLPTAWFHARQLSRLSLKGISPSLRLLCHQLPRQLAKHQQKHTLLLLHSCGECPGKIKHLMRYLTAPDLSQPWGWGCLEVRCFTRHWRSHRGKFTHCLFTAEVPPCLQLRGCKCFPDPEAPDLRSYGCVALLQHKCLRARMPERERSSSVKPSLIYPMPLEVNGCWQTHCPPFSHLPSLITRRNQRGKFTSIPRHSLPSSSLPRLLTLRHVKAPHCSGSPSLRGSTADYCTFSRFIPTDPCSPTHRPVPKGLPAERTAPAAGPPAAGRLPAPPGLRPPPPPSPTVPLRSAAPLPPVGTSRAPRPLLGVAPPAPPPLLPPSRRHPRSPAGRLLGGSAGDSTGIAPRDAPPRRGNGNRNSAGAAGEGAGAAGSRVPPASESPGLAQTVIPALKRGELPGFGELSALPGGGC